MNERIKQLAEQANVAANTAFISDSDWNTYRDLRFAELIVQECMKVTKDYTSSQGWDYSAPVALARYWSVK